MFAADPSSSLGRSVFSPDGRWLAYQQREAAGYGIYVRTYPRTPAIYQISKDPNYNRHPLWSPDGKELFYIGGQTGEVFHVALTLQPGFPFSVLPPLPRPFVPTIAQDVRNYDILPGGKRFIAVISAGQGVSGQPGADQPQIQVVLNWFEEVKQKMLEH